MKVIAMGQFKALDIENIDRSNHGMHRVLITEVLIELAIAALIVMRAGPKFNAAFHVMQTGLLPGRKLS
jgi:hypothetical protein